VRRYICNECGYEGPVILEVSHEELKRIRDDKMKKLAEQGEKGKQASKDDPQEPT